MFFTPVPAFRIAGPPSIRYTAPAPSTFNRSDRVASPMAALIITVLLAAGISALCSTTEAMLYSVPWTYIEKMREKGSRAGQLMYAMRSNINQPITAVLTLNTVANTAGASIAGALAASALGAEYMPAFAVVFTVLILVAGEILPKTLGVAYAEPLSMILAYPLRFLIIALQPVTWVSGLITRLITPPHSGPEATEDDIRVMASLSRKTGGIQQYEETAIRNILSLDQKRVEDVMTPRTVVFSLPADTLVNEAYNNKNFWHFSRIPVYADNNEDVVGLVSRREVALHMGENHADATLGQIMRPIHFVLESLTLDKVLTEFLESRQHLFAVLDEYGGLAGVISLEDVLEEMLGREIVDETDVAPDMREAARQRRAAALKAAGAATPKA